MVCLGACGGIEPHMKITQVHAAFPPPAVESQSKMNPSVTGWKKQAGNDEEPESEPGRLEGDGTLLLLLQNKQRPSLCRTRRDSNLQHFG